MFAQGRTLFSLGAGSGYAFDNNYWVLGISATHYVFDGLGAGLDIENWSGGGPRIIKYSPFVQYVFHQASLMQPYIGGFYRYAAVSGLPGVRSAGGRAGVYIVSAPNAFIGAGIVYESYLDCRKTLDNSCSLAYPEISFTFGF